MITLLFVNPRGILSFPSFPQGWTKKAERIHCPAPLPEDPTIPLLTRMLVPAPYQAPEKKAKMKGKEAKSGLRRKGASDVVSEDTKTHSSPDEDEGEEEESNSPLKGGKKKRGASADWRRRRPRKGESPSRMTPNRTPMSGAPGRSPWPDHKYSQRHLYLYIYPAFCLVILIY